MNKTYMQKTAEVKRHWHVIDASGKILGQVAVDIATKLIGKDKVTYTPHIDDGDFVIVINASKVAVSGRKNENKMYYHHSLFPGGLTEKTFTEMMETEPEKIITRAVFNMIPKNRLRSDRMARLKVYVGADHPHQAQVEEVHGK